jgi:hypothetical protein
MGIAIGDYDRDADLDYYQTNLGRNELSRNDGGTFTDVTTLANVESDSTGQLLNTGWGTFFFDVDNDSWPDLFVANGQIPSTEIIENVLLDSNRLYLNNTDGTFSDVSLSAQIGTVGRARGAAFGDLNNDGKLDFVVQNVHEYQDSAQVEIFRNSSEVANWVGIKLQGIVSNRDAFGSRVRVVVDGISTVAEVGGGSSHASQNSSVLHFGLGESTTADSVVVTFTSGIEQVLVNVAANQVMLVVEDVPVSVPNTDNLPQFSVVYENGKPFISSLIEETLMMEVLDVSGKRVMKHRVHLSKGINQLSQLGRLSEGVYLLRIEHSLGSNTLRLVNRLSY